MALQPDLSRRRRQPEIMDGPDLDESRHWHALRGLERINFLSGSAQILWRPLADLARAHPLVPIRFLDIATGAGDVPIRLARRALRAGLAMSFAGCDRSSRAIAYARRRAEQRHVNVHFFELDALVAAIPSEYDVVACSLFLHHLDENDAMSLLDKMAQAACRLVMVNDLERSVAGYWLAVVGTRLLSRSGVVHVDGPRSVEGAFTAAEALALAERAGLNGAQVVRRWPWRFLLTWRRP